MVTKTTRKTTARRAPAPAARPRARARKAGTSGLNNVPSAGAIIGAAYGADLIGIAKRIIAVPTKKTVQWNIKNKLLVPKVAINAAKWGLAGYIAGTIAKKVTPQALKAPVAKVAKYFPKVL